ncbi:hypothetical protein ACFYT4_16845 [Streptomyces sp. NPDC004609]|uniref:hypothetical protein n=1 Tax=Streptomyces sp. NPDC004609 TaxID=3364704 RepID=UPI00367F26D6
MSESDTTAVAVAARIEDLYGRPLADLRTRAADSPPGMLSALLGALSDLEFAERRIDFERDRLRQLSHPERTVGRAEAGHILDCARRLADSVTVRDTQAQTLTAVLSSLHRVPAPEQPAVPAPPPLPVPTAPTR